MLPSGGSVLPVLLIITAARIQSLVEQTFTRKQISCHYPDDLNFLLKEKLSYNHQEVSDFGNLVFLKTFHRSTDSWILS